MAEKDIPPYRRTSCLQPLTADDQQHLFGSESTKPTSDEADNFVSEAQTCSRYIRAISTAIADAHQMDVGEVQELAQLMGELADEALRRLDRAQEALDIVWQREEAAKKSPHA